MRLALHIGFPVLFSMASTVSVMAQPLAVKGIYTCTDASGNRLTADRPIAKCADREQRVLGPSGVERSRLGPALTEVEMAQRLEQRRQAQLRQQRVLEQHRRDAALLARYPQRSTHDAARRHALLQINALQELARKQMQSLDEEGLQLQQELDFYAKDTSKIPARLSGSVHMLEKTKQDQQAVLAAQAQEAQRIHQRFDAELARLQPLWSSQSPERTPPVAH
jgi:hypothetical protein